MDCPGLRLDLSLGQSLHCVRKAVSEALEEDRTFRRQQLPLARRRNTSGTICRRCFDLRLSRRDFARMVGLAAPAPVAV